MSESINELFELEELKATYKLMDERLDSQEIVSNEQLRDTMMRKFTDMRQNLKVSSGVICSLCLSLHGISGQPAA